MSSGPILNVIYTNIGRGHPFYLDGIIHILSTNYKDRIKLNIHDVFSLSSGLSLRLWKLVRYMYRKGSQGGVVGRVYEQLRRGGKTDSYGLIEKQLARGIRSFLKDNPYPTLVAHPVLVPMISDLVPVFYQHGEIAVPPQAAVTKAKRVYVPLNESRDIMLSFGCPQSKMCVTGLCVESDLAIDSTTMFEKRLHRIENKDFLVGGLFSSGAEPVGHVEKIVAAARSLSSAGHGAVIFCKAGGILEHALIDFPGISRFKPEDRKISFKDAIRKNHILVTLFSGRKQEHDAAIRLFKYLDFVISPSHERSHWAAGLGVPFFILHPIIGPFSPLNREFLMKLGVALDISDISGANDFGVLLNELISAGKLTEMAQNGFNKFDVNGFSFITSDIVDQLTG